ASRSLISPGSTFLSSGFLSYSHSLYSSIQTSATRLKFIRVASALGNDIKNKDTNKKKTNKQHSTHPSSNFTQQGLTSVTSTNMRIAIYVMDKKDHWHPSHN
ncbi:hypothetical protein pdam_00007697, partial [Pocillopora damicornis]